MTSVLNVFSNVFNGNSKEPNSITDNAIKYKKLKLNNKTTPALTQGDKFLHYQNKIKNNLVKNNNINKVNSLEGFQGNDKFKNISLTYQSENLLSNTDVSSQQQTIASLKKEYKETLEEYQLLLKKVSDKTNQYFERVSPKNPYLNQVIVFTTGHCCAVTNQGVVKYIPSWEYYTNATGITNPKLIYLDIPLPNDFWTPGSIVPTNPPLISGTTLTSNQSLGKEGDNVFVDSMIPSDAATSYIGVYGNNASSPMTFIGGTPPFDSGIQNGNFEKPIIASDSYENIDDSTTVSGWTFNSGVLMNNSSAWGYPTYPNGSQAACLQGLASISQVIQLSTGTYTLSFMACGRPGYSGANTVNVELNGNTIYTFTPSTNAWANYSTPMNVTTNGSNIISFQGAINSGDNSTAIQNVQLTSGTSSTTDSSGTFTYDMCKQSAINSGNKYFGLQFVNTNTSTGYCAVTNNYVAATQPGTNMIAQSSTALWASNTASSQVSDYGASASLTSTGTLSVYDSAGKAIYSTTITSSLPANYIGCYADTGNRAMMNTSNNAYYPLSQCKQLAQDGNYTYYAGQNMYVDASGNNANWCAASNNLSQVTEYGISTACTNVNNVMQGGPWANAVYSTNTSINCFLLLQDDGNMCIYRGTGPSDNQGLMWASGTNGQLQDANPAYAATNGKYGQNYITQGSTLSPGDFVGSTSGNMALIMQTDGNLVLYTWKMVQNSQTMTDGNTGGGQGATALYEISESGIPGKMGKLGYIDENSNLHHYPSDNFKLTKKYTKIPGTDNGGADYNVNGNSIAYGNATIDDCAKTCNSYNDCYGFAFSSNTCYPKTSEMSYTGTNSASSVDLYTRNKKPARVPKGASDTVVNIDSITYHNYINAGMIGDEKYGLAKEASDENQKISEMESKLNSLATKIGKLTSKFEVNNIKIDKQLGVNIKGTKDYLSELTKTNYSIKNIQTGISGILEDSDIVVLQRNYNYLFWSVLAVGAVLVSMNIVKK